MTAGDGTYLLTNLDAGTYEITMSLSGFADAVQQVDPAGPADRPRRRQASAGRRQTEQVQVS